MILDWPCDPSGSTERGESDTGVLPRAGLRASAVLSSPLIRPLPVSLQVKAVSSVKERGPLGGPGATQTLWQQSSLLLNVTHEVSQARPDNEQNHSAAPPAQIPNPENDGHIT